MTVQIITGDCRAVLADLPSESVHCVVTSPPYWGLRDYGVDGQLGMEPTLGEHLAVMVEVFRAVRRVLRKDGTCWVNYGDCYATTPNGRSAAATKALGNDDRTFRDKPFSTIGGVLKPKDLCMVPNRLAIALQEDGWWVRSEIIWHKPNPMPESIKDRPGSSHEKIWLFTKSQQYWYDASAVRQAPAPSSLSRWAQDIDGQVGSDRQPGKTNGNMKAVGGVRRRRPNGAPTTEFIPGENTCGVPDDGVNLRNVWTINTAAFSEAHFATFPTALIEPCIKAGCPEGGTVLDPFGGAGTTGLVADRLGRNAILIELNPAYAEMARARIKNDAPLFVDTRSSGAESRQSSLLPNTAAEASQK